MAAVAHHPRWLMPTRNLRGETDMRFTLTAIVLAAVLAGCSSEQPMMTVDQQKIYNECMSGRWSGEADTMLFGPFGWAYHDSKEKECLAKSGNIGASPISPQPGAATAPATQPGGASQIQAPSASG